MDWDKLAKKIPKLSESQEWDIKKIKHMCPVGLKSVIGEEQFWLDFLAKELSVRTDELCVLRHHYLQEIEKIDYIEFRKFCWLNKFALEIYREEIEPEDTIFRSFIRCNFEDMSRALKSKSKRRKEFNSDYYEMILQKATKSNEK